MAPVESAAIAAAGYDAASRTLFLRFHGERATYAYLHAPPEVYARLLAAPSKGRFFQAEIDPVYAYVRLEP